MELEINANKTKDVRELGKVNIDEISKAVQALTLEDWLEADAEKPNKYPSLAQVQHLIFRFSDKIPGGFKSFDTKLWSRWQAVLMPLMLEAVAAYGYEQHYFPRVMLAKLPPKAKITPHVDGPVHESRPHKIHIPIQTNDKAVFLLPPEVYHFKLGRAYEVNNSRLHAVANNGETDRIHLIFEYLNRAL